MSPKGSPINDDPLIGRKLSTFLVKRVLGRGGMAQVYYGEDVKLQRPVAIKVIDVRFRNKPAYAQRFVKEARAVATWRHENIIQIYYADDQDGFYYYVMEYIDGKDLAGLMSSYTIEGKFMPDEEILRIGRAIASALDYAHSKGVIHRDVKPSNILMSQDGRVVLSDFGLALDMQQGSSGEAFGTPHYISPEQAGRSTDAVPQSDLYSLGVMLYEMLTGVVPFDDISPTNVALQHITQTPPAPRSINPQLSLETEAVLLKALSKKPKDRYQTGAELMDTLAKALAKTRLGAQRVLPLPPMPAAIVAGKTRTVTQRPPQLQPVKPAKKRRWSLILLFFILLLVAVFALGAFLLPGGFAPLLLFSAPRYTPSPTQTMVIAPVSLEATASLPPIASATPSAIATATNTLTLTLTPTATATFTLTVTPTITASLPAATPVTAEVSPTESLAATETVPAPPASVATETVTPQPEAASPTVSASSTTVPSATTTQQYVNYKRLWLYYDPYGFYIYNASNANRSISPLAFERLDEAGSPLNRFSGSLWAEFFPTLQTARCMEIEIQGNPNNYLNPAICKERYLSRRSVKSDSDILFWTPLANSTQFRVVWQDKEVGRCEISAGFCEVFVP